MILERGASCVVSGEELAGGERPFYKGADGLDVVHPFRPPPPEFVESDRRSRNILNFGQIRHVRNITPPRSGAWHLLTERHLGCQKYLRQNLSMMTTIMLVRVMLMVAFVFMIMIVMMMSVG